MNLPRIGIAIAGVLLAACSAPDTDNATVQSPQAGGPAPDPSWTGMTHPAEVIEARQHLMIHIEELMLPIDLLQIGEQVDPLEVQEHAGLIGVMLGALPHLFPPTTNLYDATKEPAGPFATLALPPVWDSFDAFHALAGASVKAAEELASTEGRAAQAAAGKRLRDTCDACHAPYLRPYRESGVMQSDKEFDFDAVFGEPAKQP